MIHLRTAAVAAMLATAPLAARADTTWICTLSEDAVRLVCVAEFDPWRDAATPVRAARVNGTDFPLDPARRYVVDLWSPPTDWADVERLAQASLCHRSPGCTALAPPGNARRPAAGVASRLQVRED